MFEDLRRQAAPARAKRNLPSAVRASLLFIVTTLIAVVGCSSDGATGDARAENEVATGNWRDTSGVRTTSVQRSDTSTAADSDDADEPVRPSRPSRRPSSQVPPGRWRPAPGKAGGLTQEQLAEIERLESIGYLAGSRAASGVGGVITHKQGVAGTGYNLYTSGHFPGAILMSMDGTVLHEWRCEFLDAFPEREDLVTEDRTCRWRRAYLYPNGDILGIFEGAGIVRLDRDSNVIWALDNKAHHDLEVTDDGRIFVLTREAHIVPRISREDIVLEDSITILSDDGRELDRISILDAFWDSDYSRALIALDMKLHGDVTHTNTLEILDGSLADRIPAFRAGSALITMRRIDAIAVLDIETRKITWLMAGPWLGPHQPTVLPNGNIMIFDNGEELEISRVVEFDPATQEHVWQFGGDPEDEFYSKTCGSNALLPNGNILITESDGGRAAATLLSNPRWCRCRRSGRAP